jgi:hypothetical protein
VAWLTISSFQSRQCCRRNSLWPSKHRCLRQPASFGNWNGIIDLQRTAGGSLQQPGISITALVFSVSVPPVASVMPPAALYRSMLLIVPVPIMVLSNYSVRCRSWRSSGDGAAVRRNLPGASSFSAATPTSRVEMLSTSSVLARICRRSKF